MHDPSGRRMVRQICSFCGLEFWARKDKIANGYGRLCSVACRTEWTRIINTGRKVGGTPKSTPEERVRASGLINMRVRRGRIGRPDRCEQCHKRCRPDGHHEDYQKPGEVRWLCRSCHMLRHREMAREAV